MTRPTLTDEQGTTIVELIVGMAMGMVVLMGLTTVLITTLHGNARVHARVEANDSARVGMARIIEELHSACISPQIAPVRGKDPAVTGSVGSSANSLIFWRAASGQAGAVQPIPVKSQITYSNGTLTQTDYAKTGGSSPNWIFSTAGTATRLLSNVAPPSGSSGVFTYWKYKNGAATLTQLSTGELTKSEAETAIVVKVAFAASPKSSPVADASSAATIKDSATLRLTPPAYNEQSIALPCQ